MEKVTHDKLRALFVLCQKAWGDRTGTFWLVILYDRRGIPEKLYSMTSPCPVGHTRIMYVFHVFLPVAYGAIDRICVLVDLPASG